jgi:hypothetical protein
MRGKLQAALDARHSSETLILARVDAAAVEGLGAALDLAMREWQLKHFRKIMRNKSGASATWFPWSV